MKKQTILQRVVKVDGDTREYKVIGVEGDMYGVTYELEHPATGQKIIKKRYQFTVLEPEDIKQIKE